MFLFQSAFRFLKKHKHLFAVYGRCQPICCWKKTTVEWVHSHSLHQFKQKRPSSRINQHTKANRNLDRKEVLDSKVYARDIIRKVSNILRYSTWDAAQDLLDKLPIRWDSYTINQVLKTHPPMEKAWLFFNWASQLKGFKHDQFTYTTMLDIFGEARRISSMNFVFEQMQEKGIKIDAVTYTSIIQWLSNDGDVDGAVKVWEEMKEKRCHPTVVSYTAYMKVLFHHNRVKEATEIYKEMLQSGYSPNCHTYTVLMEHLASSGKYKEVLEIFNKMQEAGVRPDKAACNILIEKCCGGGETWAMTKILQFMKENSLVLRYPVYLKALKTFQIAGESNLLLRQVNPHLPHKGEKDECDPKTTDFNSDLDSGLVLGFLRRHNFVAIDYLLASMMEKNATLDSRIISTIIEVNSANCRLDGALLALEYSLKMGLKMERCAYLALIGVCIRTDSFPKVVDVVEEMIRNGLSLGTYLAALLIYKLGCAGKPICSAKIFELLPDDQKNAATYTASIAAYFSSGKLDEGLEVFTIMRTEGVQAALGTYSVLLAGLEKSANFHGVENYRKEKSRMLSAGHSASVEEMICNQLFAGDAVF